MWTTLGVVAALGVGAAGCAHDGYGERGERGEHGEKGRTRPLIVI